MKKILLLIPFILAACSPLPPQQRDAMNLQMQVANRGHALSEQCFNSLDMIAAIPDPDAALNPLSAADRVAGVPQLAGRHFVSDGGAAPDVFTAPAASELVEIASGHHVRLART